MSSTGKATLIKFQKRWQLLLWLEVFIYAFGISFCMGLLFASTKFFLVFLIGSLVLFTFRKMPWRIDLKAVCKLFNQHSQFEYSTNLVLVPTDQLSGLARIQQHKISNLLIDVEPNVQPKHNLKTAGIVGILLLVLGGLFYTFEVHRHLNFETEHLPQENIMVLQPIDSIQTTEDIPGIISQEVIVNYPNYTGLANKRFSTMDFTVLKGSEVTWKLEFDGQVDRVHIELNGEKIELFENDQFFTVSKLIEQSGFYNFKFEEASGRAFVSDLYAIDAVSDESPLIRLSSFKAYRTFEYNEEKSFTVDAFISDDYGLDKAFIVATVSRGKGESVKFREQRLDFDQTFSSGLKSTQLSKKLNLDSLKMIPGDELYFYVQAQDLKQPKANISRSETYFAVIKDTTDYGPGIDAGMGVDLMPDYFRSQRQLIIDTKKLISERGEIPENEFNRRSNDLAFDQKALRLKYGKFMGDENESQVQPDMMDDSGSEGSSEDLLGEYTHDHDGDNDHNLVEDEHDHEYDHEHGDDVQEEQDPLEKYVHNHSDPESSTLFADNLKQKLRKALSIMWDAELQLRLNEPEKSIPYQYRALDLIQDIKNSARIYVHRIGFDPPPIKENKRLTGDLEDVKSKSRAVDLKTKDPYSNWQYAVRRLEELKSPGEKITEIDRIRFESAGNEISKLAIESPGQYIKTLRQLRRFLDFNQVSENEIAELQNELMQQLPKESPSPSKTKGTHDQLNLLVLKELYE